MHTVVNSFRENICMIPFPRYLNPQGGVRIGRLLEDMDVFAVHLVFKHVLNPRQVTKSSSCPLHIFWTLSGRRSGIAFLHCDCPRRPDWLHGIFQVLPSHVQNDKSCVFSGPTVTSGCRVTSPGWEAVRQSRVCSWSSWWMESGRGGWLPRRISDTVNPPPSCGYLFNNHLLYKCNKVHRGHLCPGGQRPSQQGQRLHQPAWGGRGRGGEAVQAGRGE